MFAFGLHGFLISWVQVFPTIIFLGLEGLGLLDTNMTVGRKGYFRQKLLH